MLASALLFTCMTMLVKHLGSAYPAPLQTFYRQAASLIVLLPLMIRRGAGVFATHRPAILIFRAAAGTLAIVLANYGYQELPLGLANALSFTRALWMAPLAIMLLRERVDRARVVASVIGFAGVLMILGLDINRSTALWPALAALGSALLFAFTVTGGKIISRDHSVLTILAWGASLGLVFSIPPALFCWRWPSPADFALLALMGALSIATQACYVKGIQRGDASAIAPVDYVRVVFGIAIGYFVFHEVPPWTSLVGAAIVVGAALSLAWREHGVSVRAAREAEPEATPL